MTRARRALALLAPVLAACAPAALDARGDDVDGAGAGALPCASVAGGDVLSEFWQHFDSTYALFDVRLPDGDWAALGRDACGALPPAPSDDELFDVLIALARNLDDGHVDLAAPAPLDREEDAAVSSYAHDDVIFDVEANVEERYLDGAGFARAAEDEISWGTIGGFGYISITSMAGLDAAAPDDAIDSDDHEVEDAAAHAAMAQALAELGAVPGIVVDVRANEGGWDTVSLEIARWFAGARALGWSELVRAGAGHDDFGAPRDVFVDDAHAGAYAGPVVLLTSGATFSAAEVFVLAMRVRDHVVVLGERTSGHFSDQLPVPLSNGWLVNLSHERYVAADGNLYEGAGAPVDVAVPFDRAAFGTGRDVMLEAALARLADSI